MLGIGAPVLSVPVVLIGGLMTPGYDPALKAIIRLAEPGLPAALAIGFSILIVGLALIALAVNLALVAAPLAIAPSLCGREGWRGNGQLSFRVGAASVGMLLIGLALLPATFETPPFA